MGSKGSKNQQVKCPPGCMPIGGQRPMGGQMGGCGMPIPMQQMPMPMPMQQMPMPMPQMPMPMPQMPMPQMPCQQMPMPMACPQQRPQCPPGCVPAF